MSHIYRSSTEDLEIHWPADTTGNVQGNGLSSILKSSNGTHHGRRIPSLEQITSPSNNEEDGDYSPEDVTNVSCEKDLETALIRVPVEH